MNSQTLLSILSIFLIALSPAAFAQAPLAPAQTSETPAPTETMQGMDKMADSVTKMSEMCQMMMQKEKAALPYITAAGITLGTLLLLNLALLAVLQVQWIKYWSRLLTTQKHGEKT